MQKEDKIPTKDDNFESFNGIKTAIPKDTAKASDVSADPDLVATAMDFGPMNIKDAKESGYIDETGQAVSPAKKNVVGHPTGSFTDIGAGRSSAVKTHEEANKEGRH